MKEQLDRIEAKLDALAQPDIVISIRQMEHLLSAIVNSRKIDAIKEVRAMCGIGLKDAKDLCEKYWR